jgi:hypothetical protein
MDTVRPSSWAACPGRTISGSAAGTRLSKNAAVTTTSRFTAAAINFTDPESGIGSAASFGEIIDSRTDYLCSIPRGVPDRARAAAEVLAVTRRSTPERIAAAHRAGTLQRLLRTGMLAERVDELMAAWETVPASQDVPRDGRYWDAAFEWIVAQRR